ncbi:hypothetical protein [Halomonas korlensis]|uniref:Uncharacterized protein n=1 Tax=Halomonas korlensis TaxID=463301 RepID=A0A1I7IK96_9GAMM|nr:hypothetical protein [Halomonas korlensis]SFU73332.1 hypothetical protein SAMN04487955_10789 [Halomonas korlensis]
MKAIMSTSACALAMASVVWIAPAHSADPPRFDNLGDHGRTITTDSDEAQAYFNQGLRLAYGFARPEAIRSFQAAQRHDPHCALCAWGEAWTLGPYQNNPGGVGDQKDAHAAAQRALELVDDAAPWEQALIEAMAVRYPSSEDNIDPQQATRRYAEAMEAAVAAHPNDLDIRTLYAESLMLYRPWDLYQADGEPYPETQTVIEELETVLDAELGHGGACHLYIHTVEAYKPTRAEACADRLAEAIPGVSHIQHMPSHIYMNIGRYGDSVRANQRARQRDQAARHDAAVSTYAPHNTLMLVYSAWMDGQSGVALSAARDIGRERAEDIFHHSLQLARFGRWDELLNQDGEPDAAFQAAMWHFAQGLAQLRTGDAEAARETLARIRATREATPEDATYHFFGHAQRDLLGIAAGILAGEIAADAGRLDEAREQLQAAIALEDGLGYSEPEPWPIPVRHVLGAVLLEAGHAEEAETIYRDALAVHPDNGWSLKGLEQSLAAQGKDTEAAEAGEAFEQAWARADVWLPASRF